MYQHQPKGKNSKVMPQVQKITQSSTQKLKFQKMLQKYGAGSHNKMSPS